MDFGRSLLGQPSQPSRAAASGHNNEQAPAKISHKAEHAAVRPRNTRCCSDRLRLRCKFSVWDHARPWPTAHAWTATRMSQPPFFVASQKPNSRELRHEERQILRISMLSPRCSTVAGLTWAPRGHSHFCSSGKPWGAAPEHLPSLVARGSIRLESKNTCFFVYPSIFVAVCVRALV